jgi:prepilin-type N-terminal cleavage/methylation domain-containing protein
VRGDNRGFSLIELIITIAISVFVLGILASFLWQSSNYYRRSNEEVTLQMEAQTILNQLKDLIVEADCVEFDDSTDPPVLRIQQGEGLLYELSFDSSGKTLDFVKAVREADGSISRTPPQLFGRYVEHFQISDTGDSFIKLSFTLQGEFCTYEVKESLIYLRNQIRPMEAYW